MEEKAQPHRYTDLEKQELIEQWKQSGKSKSSFCKERSLSYHSFNDWIRRRNRKKEKATPSFVPLKIKTPENSIFAQIILKSGATVNLYLPVEASYLACLIKT
jgi:transposase-like protein